MKGMGTDEKLLIRTLSTKDPLQIAAINQSFKNQHRRDLAHDIAKETRGDLEFGLLALARGPLVADVWTLRNAFAGPGTNEAMTRDVLLCRSNADMRAIKQAYAEVHKRDLEKDVKKEMSGKTERHFLMVLQANRAEDAAPVIPQQIDADVLEIYKATEAKLGTDELIVSSIMCTRNDNQIRAISAAYNAKFRRTLYDVIKKVSECSMRLVVESKALVQRLTVDV